MRETVSLASSYGRKELPASLMQRLELMQQSALATSAGSPLALQRQHQVALKPARPRAAGRGAHAVVLAWFSFGVIASGAMGAAAVVGLRALGGAPPMVEAPAVASWSHRRPDWDTVHVAMDRTLRTRAPLSLQVMGVDDEAFEVVMHGLPAGVRPSRGAPIGEGIWVLKPTDLDGLYLTLDDAVPDAFDVKVAVLTSPGIAAAGSVVQIRLVEMAPATRTAVTVGHPARLSPVARSGMSDGPGVEAARAGVSTPAHAVAARGGDKATGQSTHKRTGTAIAGAAGVGGTWPEGAYGLGATAREPEPQSSWWQIPPPDWSPFLVGQERP
jgi:hypothetical protein